MVESCPEGDASRCCGPHVFTSVLLGILSCVLMTGGVFLAFHRWDPLWLIVSGIGVILVLIGSILHCCRTKPPPASKVCCLPDHIHSHVLLNGGSLTEQLLPLSNARSVSQLSLNMLPGYFPPVVATYGIEQHSAVVQNINRIIQQQTHQNPVTPGSPGKSFILLSLPGNTPQANIQNLVATVYQLDGSVLAETSTASDIPISTASGATTVTSVPNTNPILKNAQVQTCTVWSMANSSNASISMIPSTSTVQNNVIMSTQTEDIQPLIAINLMDCSSEPICDNTTSTQTDLSPSTPLVNVSVNTMSNAITNTEQNSSSLIDTVESPIDNLLEISSAPLNISNTSSNVLIDISQNMVEQEIISNNVREISTESASSVSVSTINQASNSDNDTVLTETVSNRDTEITSINMTVPTVLSSGLAVPSTSTAQETSECVSQDNSENNSLCVIDMDDSDSLDRSSPPPSYEDVALQSETPAGAFGLAYGTL